MCLTFCSAPCTQAAVKVTKVQSAYEPMALPPGAHPDFCSMKRLEYFYSSLEGMLLQRRATPSIKSAATHLCTLVERGIVKMKCLAQEHNTISPARVQTRSIDPESSAITMRPPSLQTGYNVLYKFMLVCLGYC